VKQGSGSVLLLMALLALLAPVLATFLTAL
jgi:hypothetical protein